MKLQPVLKITTAKPYKCQGLQTDFPSIKSNWKYLNVFKQKTLLKHVWWASVRMLIQALGEQSSTWTEWETWVRDWELIFHI